MKNKMKNSFMQLMIFSTTLFLLSSCSEEGLVFEKESSNIESILNATLLDGNSSSELTTSKIKSDWEQSIYEESGLRVSLSMFQLLKVDDSDTRFFLKSTSNDGLVKTGAFITLDEMGLYRMNGKKCTCTGQCGSGCDLTVTGSICSCSDCWPSGACVKTETATIEK